MKYRVLLCGFAVVVAGLGHPMGNFSVSHYSRIALSASGAEIHYVLDLAEIPTLQLLQQWKLDAGSPREEIERHAAAQAQEWARNLRIEINSFSVAPSFERASIVVEKGSDGMAILRVISDLRISTAPGELHYEDMNYPDRTGWKAIVISASNDAAIDTASPAGQDRSQELTAYPRDALAAPPQDLRASAVWHALGAEAPASTTPQNASGLAAKDDFLSRLLHQGQIGWGMMLAGLVVAFGLGAVHALSPGHGKTIVAAYLVGARGTPKHALFLGGMVTFTHTISVFILGLTTLFLSRYVLPEKIYPVLGAISGLSIVWIGTTLFLKRLRAAQHPDQQHDHHHEGALVHDHGDGRVHSHLPEGDVTMGSLVALGASGGLVPCPSALVLLLSSVALGRVALGLTLLMAFSTGLAVVLSGIGIVVLYAKHLLPDAKETARHAVFRYLPVASAAVITCAGILMTGVALGVIRPFAGV
jgi:nickel/cobalt transporter (NicO) family protein